MCVFSLLETIISIGHLSEFKMTVSNGKGGFILQNFAFLFEVIIYIKITSTNHSFRSDSARSTLDVFCEIRKLPNTHPEIRVHCTRFLNESRIS